MHVGNIGIDLYKLFSVVVYTDKKEKIQKFYSQLNMYLEVISEMKLKVKRGGDEKSNQIRGKGSNPNAIWKVVEGEKML